MLRKSQRKVSRGARKTSARFLGVDNRNNGQERGGESG